MQRRMMQQLLECRVWQLDERTVQAEQAHSGLDATLQIKYGRGQPANPDHHGAIDRREAGASCFAQNSFEFGRVANAEVAAFQFAFEQPDSGTRSRCAAKSRPLADPTIGRIVPMPAVVMIGVRPKNHRTTIGPRSDQMLRVLVSPVVNVTARAASSAKPIGSRRRMAASPIRNAVGQGRSVR